LYQHVDPAGVRAQEIRNELAAFMALPGAERWHTVDLTSASPATIVEWTSTYTESGVIGEAARATADKGRHVLEHAATQMVEMVRWFRARPQPERRDHHATPPTFALPFGW
jgi:creatinine amidohydrolase